MDPTPQSSDAAAPPTLPPPPGGPSAGASWTIGEVLSESWARFKERWGILLGAIAVNFLIVIVFFGVAYAIDPRLVVPQPGGPRASLPAQLLYNLICWAMGTYFTIGLLRVSLAVARREPAELGLLFSGADRFFASLGAILLSLLAVVAGLIALVIPAIIIGLGLFFVQYLAADTQLSVTECLSASWRGVRGHKLHLFGLGLVLVLVNIAGAIALLVGLVVTIPLSYLAYAVLYTRLFPGAGKKEQAIAEATAA